MPDNNISTEIDKKVDNLYNSISEKIANGDFDLAYEIASENKGFLTKYSNVKQQLLLNKYFTVILYEITQSTYSVDKNYNKFVELFEQNRNFFEVHLEKPKYNKLLRYDANIKKAVRRKKMKFILPALAVALLLLAYGIFSLNLFPKQAVNKPADSVVVKPEDSAPVINEPLPSQEEVTTSTDILDSNNINEDYLLPSGTKTLTSEDIQGMTAKDLRLAINEMYARHGYYFGPGINQRYFDSKPWYNPDMSKKNPNDIITNFTTTENNNLSFLAEQEKKLKNN